MCLYAKKIQNYHEYRVAYATVYFNEAATAYRPFSAGEKGAFNSSTRMATFGECASVCVRVLCPCTCAFMRDVFAIYDNNILLWLIMIIIKNHLLYFIEIAHTDDFPSTASNLLLPQSISVYQTSKAAGNLCLRANIGVVVMEVAQCCGDSSDHDVTSPCFDCDRYD